MARPALRVCHDFQIDAFRAKSEADERLRSGAETTAIPQLRGRKCTVFTEALELAGQFRKRIDTGGGIILIDLDMIPAGDKGFWTTTGDWHVAWSAVFTHGREPTTDEMETLIV